MEASLIVGSGSQRTTDDESDGASCRQFHQCEYDSDCAAQLGWDYVCETVDSFTTLSPSFSRTGDELPSIGDSRKNFSSIVQGNATGKRCVYRGKGAPCQHSVWDHKYLQRKLFSWGVTMCAPNYYCQPIEEEKPYFNNRISRYAKSLAFQNASSDVEEDDLDTDRLWGKANWKTTSVQWNRKINQ